MSDENEDDQRTTAENIAIAPKLPMPQEQPEGMTHQCPTCYRWFKSQPALNMHTVRKHSNKSWSTAANFKGTGKSKAEKRKEYKADYDAKKKAEKMQQRREWHLGAGTTINFCPECGCNLQVYNVARATAARINETE